MKKIPLVVILVLCFLLGTVMVYAADPVRYEAEDADEMGNGTKVADNNAGFSGTAFADYAATDSYVEFKNVNVDTAGQYNIIVGYANADGGQQERPLDVIVNGEKAGNIAGALTTDWTTWVTETVTANLNAGANTIKLNAPGAARPNVDYIDVEFVSASEAGSSSPTTGDSGMMLYLLLAGASAGAALKTMRRNK